MESPAEVTKTPGGSDKEFCCGWLCALKDESPSNDVDDTVSTLRSCRIIDDQGYLGASGYVAYNVSPHHAVVFGATKDFERLNCAYQTAPKTIERPL